MLEKSGELDNTIIIVTSDHGMPFPRAKASLYDAGSHVPLAIRWPARIKSPGRTYDGLVNLSDIAPTFLEADGVPRPEMMTATSLMDIFASAQAPVRPSAFVAMERHDGCRKGGKGYPCRAIRTADFLYIKNYEPDRWPAGDPDRRVCARDLPYGEVDTSPTKTLMMENVDGPGDKRLHDLAFGKRPGEELYDLKKDPAQMNNIAGNPDYAAAQKRLSTALQKHLEQTKDPRALGLDAPWDYYPYYGMRRNKDWTVDLRPGETRPPEPAKPSAKQFSLQPALDAFAPGWTVADCGPYRNVGGHEEWAGRNGVLITHPLNRDTACTMKRSMTLPGGKPMLRLVVGHNKSGDWRLVVRANGTELLTTIVGPKSATGGWMEKSVDLTAYAGKAVTLELVNQATGWQFEHGLWDEISIDVKK
jgi:hypothetical protein